MWKYQILLIFRKQFAIKSQKKKTRSCSRDPNLINFYKFFKLIHHKIKTDVETKVKYYQQSLT